MTVVGESRMPASDDAITTATSASITPPSGMQAGDAVLVIVSANVPVATSITNGKPGDRDVLATVNAYTLFEEVPVVRSVVTGGSFARQSNKRDEGAIYAGSNLWRFSYLGEIDFINDRTGTAQAKDQYAAYGELDLLLLEWLNLRGTFDFVKVAGNRDQTRYGIGAEPFINRVLQPRIQYRINNAPGTLPDQNDAELWVELHFFL